MVVFIAVVICIVVIILFSGKDKKINNDTQIIESTESHIQKQSQRENRIVKTMLPNVNHSYPVIKDNDDSIIDVTGQSQEIPVSTRGELVKYAPGVPQWAHQYVYAYEEIFSVGDEQQKFYNHFKDRFVKGNFLDIEGNSNYAFILLFDLVNWYDKNRNLFTVKGHFESLAKLYPKTKTYIIPALLKKARTDDEKKAIHANLGQLSYSYPQYNYNSTPDYWKTGEKYKKKLKLKDSEVAVLNRLSSLNNNFTNIEYCFIEVIRVFLSTLEGLSEKYVTENLAYDAVVAQVADVILQKEFRYKHGSHNYSYGMESVSTELYINIFKRSENIVRENYGHKRKVNTDLPYTAPAAKEAFETKIVIPLTEIFPGLEKFIKAPDEATDIELFTQNTSRWKTRFEQLSATYQTNNSKEFTEEVLMLGKLNAKNPSVENVFYEASKFVAKTDKQQSLILYIYYLHYDLMSATFDNKQLTKTIQKNLFTSNEQLHEFEKIISSLIADKNLSIALNSVAAFYAPRRKKIKLDITSIQQVQQQHSGTVELLNEYLQDEYEDDNNTVKSQEINNEELKIEITQKNESNQNSIYNSEILFTAVQEGALEMFVKKNFTVEQNELEVFAKSQGAFKSQLVESINDICFESLDDILIEEEDEFYIVNPDYYKKLLTA